jgi:F0F1-type ATP synthase assembly protein I
MARRRKHQPTDATFYRGAMRWMGIGVEFCLVIGLFVFGGYWLDKLEDTSPGWMILGFFIGFGVMMYIIVKRAQATQKDMETPLDDEDEEDI